MYAIIFHAHQKLDKVARKHLGLVLPKQNFFPSIKEILHFEGSNGPDGANLKKDENGAQPWHFVNPFDTKDTAIDEEIQYHYESLVSALKDKDEVKASFQAAWLAHSLVDGLTPAHHYPYEEELARLRGDDDRNSRKGLGGRVMIKGTTIRDSTMRSLKLSGPKGLLTNHMMFEAGAYIIIRPLDLKTGIPTKSQLKAVMENGVIKTFRQNAKEIAEQGLYHRFIDAGWTWSLNRAVRKDLAPRMARMITLAWYSASMEASKS